MEHIFFDTSKLSDDELITRIRKINEYLSFQRKMGHDDAVRSAELIMSALLDEQEKRISLNVPKNYNKENKDNVDKQTDDNIVLEMGKIYTETTDDNK